MKTTLLTSTLIALAMTTTPPAFAADVDEEIARYMNNLGFIARMMTLCDEKKLSVRVTLSAAMYLGDNGIKDAGAYLKSFDEGVDDASKQTFTPQKCADAVKIIQAGMGPISSTNHAKR